MRDPVARLRQFFAELKRRSIYQVAVAYAVVGFVLIEAADLIFPALNIPSWAYSLVVVLVLFGFPIALVIAWAFEVTPEGVRRTPASGEPVEDVGEPAAGEGPSTVSRGPRGRRAVGALVGLGLVGAAVAGGWYLVGSGGETEPRAGDRSIAVLPFEPLGQAEPDAFTEGMHDDLLARLSNVSDLKVISRTAVQQYRGSEMTTGEIARELGVRWVLEGGVQEMGEEIQVNAQLIDPRTETHAWADSYRRDLTAASLFDLQSEITMQIARSLEAELTSGETERVERRPTEDLDAYRLYVQGRSRLDTRTPEGTQEAVDYFQRAVERDSSYALAWSGLADAIGLYPSYGYGPDSLPSTLPEHADAARRAVELDPDLGEARASMGLVHFHQQNGPEALRELQRAVELKPSYVQAHHWLGYVQLLLGRPEAAFEHLSLAVELDPRHPATRGVLVWTQIARGEVQSARQHANALSRLVPEELWQRVSHELLVLYHEGHWDELEVTARKRLEEEGQLWLHFHLARTAALNGDTTAALEHLDELREAEAYIPEGLAHAALGDPDAAFSAWRKVEDWGPVTRMIRYFYPDILDPLREDPRYRELIREFNRQWGLNPDGSLPVGVDVSFDPSKSDA